MNSNNEKLFDAIGQINDDFVLEVEKAKSKDTVTVPDKSDVSVRRIRFWSAQFAGIAAAAVLLFVGTVFMLRVFAPDPPDFASSISSDFSSDTVTRNTEHSTTLTLHRGLPINDYRPMNTPDIEYGTIPSLVELFADVPRIAVVRAEDVITADVVGDSKYQSATLRVLEHLYCSDDVYCGESYTITQERYNFCIEDGFSSMRVSDSSHWLKEGGVYVLPMYGMECGDCTAGRRESNLAIGICDHKIIINDELFVLFEIDDKGEIFSHSQNGNFNYFDGKDYGILINEIRRLRENEEFIQSRAYGFESTLNTGWAALVEFTASDYGESAWETPVYTANVNCHFNDVQIPDSFDFFSDNCKLEDNGRYVAFFGYYEPLDSPLPEWQLWNCVPIDGDGLIHKSNFTSSMFDLCGGMTVDEFVQFIERLAAFRRSFERGESPAPLTNDERPKTTAVTTTATPQTTTTVPETSTPQTTATVPNDNDAFTVDKEKFIEYLTANRTYIPEEIILSPVETYSKGIAFYDLTSQRGLERMWTNIGGYKFTIDNPLLYFYVFETSEFLGITGNIDWIDWTEFLSDDELKDLAQKADSEFFRIRETDEFKRVHGGWSVEQ
ncbi:MAG: hypothetical protein FWF82_01245 [Oscillospiraceae bacterium]|nr:hypothetical protein [Oscillospiraceae bacterium]